MNPMIFLADEVAGGETAADTATSGFSWSGVGNAVLGWLKTDGIKIVISLFAIFVLFKLINFISRRFALSATKKKYDKTLSNTINYVLKWTCKIVVLIAVVGWLGIDTSGLTALVASLGVAAGLALNGALSNFAGGVLIILTRPFKLDDFIEAQGYSGTVENIHIVSTKLRTPDNKVVYVPNGALSSGVIVNYSEKPTRRLDIPASVSYSTDFDTLRRVLLDLATANELVLKDPAPTVCIDGYADSSINFSLRVYVKGEDYWTVNFALKEGLKKALDAAGIEIPFPQVDVHMKQE